MLAGARMDEFQLARVQALAAKPLVGRGRAVKRIAEQRMPDVRHVDANLMRAPGLEPAADVRVAAVARNDLPVRDRAARALLCDGHFLAVGRMPTDGRVNRARILAHAAANDGLVYARQAAVGKLSRQRQMRKIVFRDYQQSRRVLVDAVDDAGALLAADAGQ